MSAPVRTATPIRKSVARVADRTAKRLGYGYVAICQCCERPIVIRLDELDAPVWRHRHDGDRHCPPRQLEATVVS